MSEEFKKPNVQRVYASLYSPQFFDLLLTNVKNIFKTT